MLATENKSFILRTPGVQGGAACIRNSRITVWGLVRYRQLGLTDAALLSSYHSLAQEDLEVAWDYYQRHQLEIESEIELQETDEFESTPELRAREKVLLELTGRCE